MSSRTIKNTRLVYTDENRLKVYQALPAEEFKEFFMTYLTYKVGDKIEVSDFSSATLYGLFMQFKDKIDYNEEKWERQAAAKRENGKKGGRPKKTTLQDTLGTEFNQTEVEVENKAIPTPQTIQDDTLYTPRVESPSNRPQTLNKDDLAEFEKVIKEYQFNINDIVRDLRTNTESSIKQANIRLKELLNHYDIMPYREKITKFIEDMTYTGVAS